MLFFSSDLKAGSDLENATCIYYLPVQCHVVLYHEGSTSTYRWVFKEKVAVVWKPFGKVSLLILLERENILFPGHISTFRTTLQLLPHII